MKAKYHLNLKYFFTHLNFNTLKVLSIDIKRKTKMYNYTRYYFKMEIKK